MAYPNIDPNLSHVAISLYSDRLREFCNQRISEHLHRRMTEYLMAEDAQVVLFEITTTLLQRYEDYIRGGEMLVSDHTDTDGEILKSLEDQVMNMSHRMLPVLFVPTDLQGRFLAIMVKY